MTEEPAQKSAGEREREAALAAAREATRAAQERTEALREAVLAAERDPALQQEWLRQNNGTYAALIGIGLVMVQPFLTASSLDLTAMISVVAFAVSTPLLAALVMVNWHETFRGRASPSRLVNATRSLGQAAAITGVVAGFWHITWIAGVAMLVAGMVALGVHSAGYTRLELAGRRRPTSDKS